MLSGYDHLAFVFGIIFFLTRFMDIVKYVTAFTVGHSITLIFATFNAIQVNYFLVDAIIALSVVYIAFHNLDGFKKFFKVKAPNMLAMIFGLGLIHGLGLSTRLQQLPLSQEPGELLLNIISFNIGIEIGQIMALTVMLIAMAFLRKRAFFPSFSKMANTFLIAAGAYLFLMQMHGYAHTSHPEDFAMATTSSYQQQIKTDDSNMEWRDVVQITIPAYGEKEYKLNLDKYAVLKYSWQTDGAELFFDFHGEPTTDDGSFTSYNKGNATQSSNTLITSFEGTHGWYWRNKSSAEVNITLKTAVGYQQLEVSRW